MIINKSLSLALAAACLLFGTAEAADQGMIVKFRHTPGAAEEALIKDAGGRIERRLKFIDAVKVVVPASAIEALRRHPSVESVQANQVVALPSPGLKTLSVSTGIQPLTTSEYDLAWGVRRIGAEALHNQSVTGRGIKVAILDTGIDLTHPELQSRVKGGDNFISLDPTNHSPADDNSRSHGTHVAGIVAAARNGSGVVGVAPDVDLYIGKVLDGGGFGTEDSLLAGIEWALAQQVHIINLSVDLPVSDAMAAALARAEGAGILVVAAAGNRGEAIPYPPSYDSAIVVTATDQNNALASFSSTGPQVDLAAPGTPITSTVRNGGYAVLSGTSQAAPHVTGAAALLLSALPPDLDNNGLVDFRDVRLRLQQLALDLGAPGRDPQFGYGLLQLTEPATPVPTITLSLARNGAYPGADAKTATLASGVYEVVIQNKGLAALSVRAFDENGFAVRDFTRLIRFKRAGTTEHFIVDASGRTLDVDFTPFGKSGSTAQVIIRKQ